MRPRIASFLACLLLGCAAEGPTELELEVGEGDPDLVTGWVVPGAAAGPAQDEEAPVDPDIPPELEPSPLPSQESVRPRLAFVWEWGDFAHTESCNFGVEFVGGPAVSEDGRYVLHDRKDEFWESDGGETWRDYDDQEPLEEGSLALVDLHTGTTTWLGSLLENEPPHRNSGDIHCRKLRPLLEAGIERVNAEIPDTAWRPMAEAQDLGVRVLDGDNLPADLEREGADRSPVEFMLRNDAFVLRRKGVEVLHREAVRPLETCNMPLALTEALIDLDTGFTLASVAKHCVCFGSESQRYFAFTLPRSARERIAELAPHGGAVRESEGW